MTKSESHPEMVARLHAHKIGNLYIFDSDSQFSIMWWHGQPRKLGSNGRFEVFNQLYIKPYETIQYLDCYAVDDFEVFSFLRLTGGYVITCTGIPWTWLRPYGTTIPDGPKLA